MKRLLRSEWERLWSRKTTWFSFFSIPIILLGSAKYLLSQNEMLSTNLAQYTNAWNFPILGLSEMLITAFQGIILIIVVLTVTEEYRTGQIRMVLIRSYSYTEILLAKFIVSLGTILLFFFTYFIVSNFLGVIIFSTPKEFPLFFHEDLATILDGMIYNLKFYGIAISTVVAMNSILFFIAVVSRTTTTAIGSGIGFLLFSLLYPHILPYIKDLIGEVLYMKLFFTSIPMIQWQGITLMLAEKNYWMGWNFSVIGIYTFVFACLTMLMTKKKDSFI
ncbi:ABC transporter permease [Psychrobacillus sp. NPDC096389]|uniref:ABC transporter permease n=1 Tax=Psychrobacillus sp. NPDC096389 TaxID=3364490 RepID=UPI0038194D0B